MQYEHCFLERCEILNSQAKNVVVRLECFAVLAGCQSLPPRARKNPLEHERNYVLGMSALVTVCSRNTKVNMVSAWMHWLPYALGTRAELWFGHGCSTNHTQNTNLINYALGMNVLLMALTRTRPRMESWFGHGRTGCRMVLENERYFASGIDALVSVCSWNRILVWAWMHWLPMLLEHERNYGLGMDALVIACS